MVRLPFGKVGSNSATPGFAMPREREAADEEAN
jgi:hypothetical protein